MPGLTEDLVMAHYHRGDKQAAERELQAAEKVNPDDPRVLLYRGMLLLDAKQTGDAARKFERAATADTRNDSMASFYATHAWEQAQKLEEAKASLQRAAQGPRTNRWANEAREVLKRLDDATGFEAGAWSATASAGIEYDDNVSLRGDSIIRPNDVSEDDDVRGWWRAEARAEAFRTKNWAGGILGSYFGTGHVDLQQFNQNTLTGSLWLDRRIDDASFLRLQPFYAYTWYFDPYLANMGATLSYHRDFDDKGAGVLHATYAYRDYLFNTSNPRIIGLNGEDFAEERDRDGTDFVVGYDHEIGVTEKTTLRGGIAHGRYEAEGNEYSHVSYGGHVGLSHQLPWKLVLDLSGEYAYQPYRQQSSFPVPYVATEKRRDHYYGAGAQLSRPINDWLSVAGYYRYARNDSNTTPFDYQKNVIGAYFTVHYGPALGGRRFNPPCCAPQAPSL